MERSVNLEYGCRDLVFRELGVLRRGDRARDYVVKFMTALQELRKLIQMTMRCVQTLFWSVVLTFLLMTSRRARDDNYVELGMRGVRPRPGAPEARY